MYTHLIKELNNMNTNESSIAALVSAANQKKEIENKGREALAAKQAQNNKSAFTTAKSTDKKITKVGKRRNVYFSPKSLECIDVIEKMDGVGMSPAIQAALFMFANTTDKKREAAYRELKIQCDFDN